MRLKLTGLTLLSWHSGRLRRSVSRLACLPTCEHTGFTQNHQNTNGQNKHDQHNEGRKMGDSEMILYRCSICLIPNQHIM